MEVLEDITADTEFIEAVRSLSAQGYTIALDDFVYRESLLDSLRRFGTAARRQKLAAVDHRWVVYQ